jgi:putative CocE/NonD family hydrolase
MQDGVEVADWAARLPGSTGRVGLAGSSYVALNQIFTAALAGPRSPVKAIVPAAVGSDLYRDLAFGGGIPNTEFAGVWEGLRVSMVAAPPDEPQQDPQSVLNHVASRAVTLAQFDAGLYAEVDAGGPRAFDNGFWESRAPASYLDRIATNGIPALIISGWHDVYQRGAVLDYAGLQNAWARLHGEPGRPAADAPPMTAGQRPTPRYQLVVGPWFHNPMTLGLTFQQLQLAWFDRWLKGIGDGIDRTRTPLHVFELGANRWVDVSRWPLPQTHAHTYYLGAGTLSARRPAASASDSLPWSDVRSPCNTGTDQWSTGLPAYVVAELGGPGDPCAQNDSTTQAGALTYTSAPFTSSTTIAGPIDVTLFLASTAADAEVVASVDVVAPDGSSRPISSGAMLGSLRAVDRRLSWRQDGQVILPWHPYTAASPRDMKPGAVQRVDIEVYPTAARIAPGDSLRLELTSGDTALAPSPPQAARLAGGVYSIARGGADGSWITLPTAPAAALPTSPIAWGGCNASC